MHNGAIPDELLLLVFEAIATPAHTADEYDARQKTLSVLSRVARRYSRLARPLLWEDLRSSRRAHLERLTRAEDQDRQAVARATRLFRVSTAGARSDEGEPVSPNEGAEAARCFPAVEEIRIECVRSALDLTLLGVHVGLRRLVLTNVDLGDSSPVHLPQLEQLRLERTIIPSSLLTAWLDPSYLPSVKAVRLVALYSALHAGAPSLSFSRPFLDQLDIVQTPGLSLEVLQAHHDSVNPPFLFASSLVSLLPRHLILAAHQLDGAARATTMLRKVGAQLERAAGEEERDEAQRHPHERVILLPRSLDALAAADRRVGEAVAVFVATCSVRQTTVLWHGDVDGRESERDLVCGEFWRWARELKERRAADL
ncbi:uncharacterized protein RHOBADRAFT_55992 [Rhodotorula graminis WP1]|uniref:F-box domain-containing protein n=1 Tax=Rhodotorula graminis (strain WP1) TaxID=578459 RepID=A0A0P9IRY5_RHOGW|nr:uncharacterized protein RHOBADRAFT_55992 [Rhodotorula graminis WP1]KPV72159.1 hypothetical protein RHOBADRAFT_55992 [Rhodotorula graminis WP1]